MWEEVMSTQDQDWLDEVLDRFQDFCKSPWNTPLPARALSKAEAREAINQRFEEAVGADLKSFSQQGNKSTWDLLPAAKNQEKADIRARWYAPKQKENE
jgi:hypothetical protein